MYRIEKLYDGGWTVIVMHHKREYAFRRLEEMRDKLGYRLRLLNESGEVLHPDSSVDWNCVGF